MRNARPFSNAIAAGFIALLVANRPALGQTQENWQDYIDAVAAGGQAAAETAMGEFLPPGVGEIAATLEASPKIVKTGLITYLHKKIRDAALEGDFDKVDRYQAFLTCITTNDCSKVQSLTSPPEPSPTPAPPNAPPVVVVAPQPPIIVVEPTPTNTAPEPNPTDTGPEPAPTNT